MKRLVQFRHGKRHINTGDASGDGPLTKEGLETTRIQAHQLAAELKKMGVYTLDCAIVSGSIRCAQTFAEIWRILLKKSITVTSYDMHERYYCSATEAVQWNRFYKSHGTMLSAEIDRLGEKAAVMKHLGHLVIPPSNRTVDGIKQAIKHGAENILLVTHAPHDTLIAEALTGTVFPDCLKLGCYRIL